MASVFIAFMSEILVGAVEGTAQTLGMSQAFIGLVILAVVGGAAETGSAVVMAVKNRVDLSSPLPSAVPSRSPSLWPRTGIGELLNGPPTPQPSI